ncbi:MAG: serine/threonine-protein kinase, partial [Myxococcota bacterium]|nr:serine/threonine-protein kinase [Myxococcota bacterium]
MSETPASEQIGTVLGGKYRLTRLLGEGGMGRVFAAEHTVLGRDVAVKVLHPQYQTSPETAERFLREARAASAIDHPGVIQVLDADRDETGALYMVMELLEGESLGDLLERRGRLEPEEAVAITVELLAALHCAHEHHTIHRDLKPDN